MLAPAFLAATVTTGNFLLPDVSILTLITLLAPCYPLVMPRRQRIAILSQYVHQDLSNMGSEIILFVAAGILGAGLSSLVTGHAVNLAGEYNHVFLVCARLALILAVSCVGIHPLVGITVVGGVLSSAKLSPDLLAHSI